MSPDRAVDHTGAAQLWLRRFKARAGGRFFEPDLVIPGRVRLANTAWAS
jgi:hypothetical protein